MIERVILHAGTEKTGSTALQVFLESHARALLARGVFWPSTGENYRRTGRFPKHRWLLEALMANAPGRAEAALERSLAAAPLEARILVLSDETLYGDWPHVTQAGREALSALAGRLTVELWVWFREPVDFARGMYIQMLKNPRGPTVGNGEDLALEAAIALPWFVSRLDYAGFVRAAERVIGAGAVRTFAWQGDTVGQFLDALALTDMPAPKDRLNASVGRLGVDLLRWVNRWPLGPDAKAAAVRLIASLDRLAGLTPFVVPPEVAARIR